MMDTVYRKYGRRFSGRKNRRIKTDVESVWVCVRTKNGYAIIGSVYRPPGARIMNTTNI